MGRNIIYNLIDNAIKYSLDLVEIDICARRENSNIVISIKDNGIGISNKNIEHIFDKFYQADSSRMAEGNGLGLALVKRVLDVCGGTVAVQNLPEAGCRFTVTLPLEQTSK